MSEAVKFFDGILGEMAQGIHTCMLGQINKFDHKKMKAEVIPLHKRRLSNGQTIEYPLLLEVPVAFFYANGFFIRPPYKKGDTVIVVFAESDIDRILLSASKEDPGTNRRHSLQDAIVIGSWLNYSDELPIGDEDTNNMVIGHANSDVCIRITSAGEVHIKGSKVYLGGFSDEAIEGVPLGEKLKDWLDNHTHSIPQGISGGPTSESPKPSQVVKTK